MAGVGAFSVSLGLREKAPGCLAVLENLTETKPSNVNKGTIWNWKHSCLDDFILDKKSRVSIMLHPVNAKMASCLQKGDIVSASLDRESLLRSYRGL